MENTLLSNEIESEVTVSINIAINPISIGIMRQRQIPEAIKTFLSQLVYKIQLALRPLKQLLIIQDSSAMCTS